MILQTPCTEWAKSKSEDGYGRIKIAGKLLLVHRLSYAISKGVSLEDIDGLIVRHKCDNPGCVNPDHLEVGSVADNAKDMVDRNRQSRGQDRPAAKLTDEDVRVIRSQYTTYSRDFGVPALARRFGIAERTVRKVLARETWRHIA